jgi:signal transduction histidine kinase
VSDERRPVVPLLVLGFLVVGCLIVLAWGWRDQGPGPLLPILFGSVGALIARRTGNRIGWLFLWASVFMLVTTAAEAYVYRSSIASTPLPGVSAVAVFDQATPPILAAFPVAILMLYPTGRPPTPRWRPWLWILVAAIALIEVFVVTRPGPINTNHSEGLTNPFGVEALAGIAGGVLTIAGWVVAAVAVAALVGLVLRYRRSSGDEREQVRWLAYLGILAGIFLALSGVGSGLPGAAIVGDVGWAGFVLCLGIGVPAAITLAILKYHLYGIDVVINKTVVYAALAVFITAVYVLLVVGLGALFGSRGKPNAPLSILATVVVAVAFQPVRERVQRFANRLVYGKRATPYEALSNLSDRVASSLATEELLPRMARILAEATGAVRADIWLAAGGSVRIDASWPVDAERLPPMFVADEELTELAGYDRVAPIRHRGDLLGALSIVKKRGEAVTPTEDRLIVDLAGQAGLVLRNVGLTEQLLARVDEIRASRQRLVAARDEERRRLERNIHDGAQQQLVALAVKLRLAGQSLDRDEAAAAELLRQVRVDSADALENLSELARGIYPPLLADRGLIVALEAQARKSPVATSVSSEGIDRYPQEIEAAVYFCALEALNNVAKYSGADRTYVRVGSSNGELRFEVSDDGHGFDSAATRYGTGLQGMADRLDAVGGSLEIRSAPGSGTTVVGRVPVNVQGSTA